MVAHRRHGAAPPRVVHEVDRRADLLGHLDRGAQVALRSGGRRPVDALGPLAPLLVVVIAPAAQHDALRRRHGDLPALMTGPDAGHAAVLDDEHLDGRRQPQLHPEALRDRQQRAHQRRAHAHEVLAPRQHADGTRHDLGAADHASRRRPGALE